MNYFLSALLVLTSASAFAARIKPARGTASATNVQTTQAPTSSGTLYNVTLSENTFIPGQGQSAFSTRATYIYRDLNYKTTVNNQTSRNFETTEGTLLNVRYDRGFAPGWGFFGEVGVPLTDITVSRRHQRSGTLKGMTDAQFGVNHVSEETFGQLFYGGTVNFSPGDRTWGTEREDGSMQSGGMGLAGHVGLQKDYGTFIGGGRLRVETFGDRSESYKNTDRTSVNLTRKPGNVYSAEGFAERPWNNYLVGGLVGVDSVQSTGYAVRPTGSDPTYLSTDSYTMLRGGVYGRMSISGLGNPDILPSVQYGKVMDGGRGSLAVEGTTENTAIGVTGRWTL